MTLEPDSLGQAKADLATTLRGMRKRAGRTQVWLARRCNMSQTKLSNIETGRMTPGVVDVELILAALDISPETTSQVVALARRAHTEWQGKRMSWRKGIARRQAELSALEAEATEMRFFLPAMVTGLLATPEYIRASLASVPADTAAVVARKLERQAVLHQDAKRFTFLLTEQAVRWNIVPPASMIVQIERLIHLSTLPSIRMGVLPADTALDRGPMNTFTVYDRRLATVENFTGRVVFRDPRDIAEHLRIFERFERSARFGEAARDLLRAWSAALRP